MSAPYSYYNSRFGGPYSSPSSPEPVPPYSPPLSTASVQPILPQGTGPTVSSISPQTTGPTIRIVSPQITGHQEQQQEVVPRLPLFHQQLELPRIRPDADSPPSPPAAEQQQVLSPRPISYSSLPQFPPPVVHSIPLSIRSLSPAVPQPLPQPQPHQQHCDFTKGNFARFFQDSTLPANGAKTIVIFGKKVTMEAVVVLSSLMVVIIVVAIGVGAWLNSKSFTGGLPGSKYFDHFDHCTGLQDSHARAGCYGHKLNETLYDHENSRGPGFEMTESINVSSSVGKNRRA